jgi:hypothetical protein
MNNVWTRIKAQVGRRRQCFVGHDPSDIVTVEWKHSDWINWYAWQTLRRDAAERMVAAYRKETRFDWRIRSAPNTGSEARYPVASKAWFSGFFGGLL